jgi:hypothetical protein
VPVGVAFSGLSPLVVEDVVDEDSRILMRARTPDSLASCPACGAESDKVHGYHEQTVTDVPVDGRGVIVRVRRLVCPTVDCCNTFRKKVPGVLQRYQRRTARLTVQVRSVVRELVGRQPGCCGGCRCDCHVTRLCVPCCVSPRLRGRCRGC